MKAHEWAATRATTKRIQPSKKRLQTTTKRETLAWTGNDNIEKKTNYLLESTIA